MTNENKLYQGLVELGNVEASQVPQEALEIITNNFGLTGDDQAKRSAVALLAKAANSMSEAEFLSGLHNDDFSISLAQEISEGGMEGLQGGARGARRQAREAKGGRGKKESDDGARERLTTDAASSRRGCW